MLIFGVLCQAPDMSNVAEFKKGFIMRKCCIDPDGRKSEMLLFLCYSTDSCDLYCYFK